MSLDTLHDLLVHELKDLYSAEKQLVAALPKMIKATTTPELKDAFTTHLEQTKEHVARIEQAMELIGGSPRGMKCKGMEGLLEEGSSLLEEDADPDVLDVALIGAAQRVEHYEIAAYGSACALAASMQHNDVLSLLELTLSEELETDSLLAAMAEELMSSIAERDGQEAMGVADGED